MTETEFKAKCKRIDSDLKSCLQHWLDQMTTDVWDYSSNEYARLQKQRKNVIDFVDFIHHATITLNGGTN